MLPIKQIWLFLATVLLISTLSAQSPIDPDFICKLVESEQHQHPTLSSSGTRSTNAMSNYDLKYHRMEWFINPKVHYIEGTVTSYFVPTESAVQTIFMELSDSLTVNAVRYRGRPISFEHSPGDWLAIFFPDPLAENQLDSISIEYEGAPPDGGRSFEQDEHEGIPIVWTLSQPYGARDWWPCKQTLNDKIDSIDIYLSVPNGYTGVGNGVLMSEVTTGDTTTFHFRHRHPIAAYLVATAVTQYEKVTHYYVRDGDSIPVVNYLYPEDTAVYKWQSRRAVDFMQIFDTLLIPYPFSDELYGHAQFGWPGGMEHQTMSFMYNFDWALVGHELAHSWAGDLVTCGSWQDIWVNEGLTDFLTGWTYQYLFEGRYWHVFNSGNVERIIREPGGSVYVPAEDTMNVSRVFSGRLSYRKGAMVIHVLRGVIGDQALIAGLRNYFSDPALRNGYAKTEDLQRHFETTSDTSLTEFFADWIYGEGHPIYEVDAEQTADSLLIRLTQRSSHPSVEFFESRVPIGVYFPEGDSQVVYLNHQQSTQRFAVPISRVIDTIRFDPDVWLIAQLDTLSFRPQTFNAQVDVTVYPQPVEDFVNVRWSQENYEVRKIGLVAPDGRLLFEETYVPNLTPGYQISLESYPTGVYYLLLETNTGFLTQKLVKQ